MSPARLLRHGERRPLGTRLPLVLFLAVLSVAPPAFPQKPGPGATPPAPAPPSFPVGQIIPSVPTQADPGQTFALYLPPQYDPEKAWPLIIAFDPGARGSVPVELFKPAAEKYGYLVVGLNNSRNGPLRDQVEAFRAVWNDVLVRFSLDAQRLYAAGFSGGARTASYVGYACPHCFAGVIASGAAFSDQVPLTKELSFAYFSTVGYYDFNFGELVRLHETLDTLGIPNQRRVFDGVHQWAPPEVLTEAVEWMELEAMARGAREPDPAFVADQWTRAEAAARAAEEQHDLFTAYLAYKSLAADFSSLRDVSAARARAEELGQSSEVRAALQKQAQQIEKHRQLTRELVEQIPALNTTPTEQMVRVGRVRSRIAELRERRERETDPEETTVLRRALSFIVGAYFETGQHWTRERNFPLAAVYYEVAAEGAPKSPGVEYNLACVYALAGRKKDALAALGRAVEKGFTDVAQLESDPDLAAIRSTPEYKKLVESLAGK